jgi:hypothetical protein
MKKGVVVDVRKDTTANINDFGLCEAKQAAKHASKHYEELKIKHQVQESHFT